MVGLVAVVQNNRVSKFTSADKISVAVTQTTILLTLLSSESLQVDDLTIFNPTVAAVNLELIMFLALFLLGPIVLVWRTILFALE